MKEPMSFEKFKAIMNTIMTFDEKRDKFSKFIEEEISTSTYCIVDFGSTIEHALISLLADEFNCWYSFQFEHEEGGKLPKFDWWNSTTGMENDIEAWLYNISDEPRTITVNNIERNIDSLESFYEFLVEQYNEKLNLTET